MAQVPQWYGDVAEPERRRASRWLWRGLLVFAVALGGAGLWYFVFRDSRDFDKVGGTILLYEVEGGAATGAVPRYSRSASGTIRASASPTSGWRSAGRCSPPTGYAGESSRRASGPSRPLIRTWPNAATWPSPTCPITTTCLAFRGRSSTA